MTDKTPRAVEPESVTRCCKMLEAENAQLRKALRFYGYEAIHNPEAASKSEQYWNDKGIWDHGEIARKALKQTSEDNHDAEPGCPEYCRNMEHRPGCSRAQSSKVEQE